MIFDCAAVRAPALRVPAAVAGSGPGSERARSGRDATPGPRGRGLLHRRERAGQADLVHLGHDAVAAARRGPDALLARLVPDRRAVLHALVRPDVVVAIGLANSTCPASASGESLVRASIAPAQRLMMSGIVPARTL